MTAWADFEDYYGTLKHPFSTQIYAIVLGYVSGAKSAVATPMATPASGNDQNVAPANAAGPTVRSATR